MSDLSKPNIILALLATATGFSPSVAQRSTQQAQQESSVQPALSRERIPPAVIPGAEPATRPRSTESDGSPPQMQTNPGVKQGKMIPKSYTKSYSCDVVRTNTGTGHQMTLSLTILRLPDGSMTFGGTFPQEDTPTLFLIDENDWHVIDHKIIITGKGGEATGVEMTGKINKQTGEFKAKSTWRTFSSYPVLYSYNGKCAGNL